MSESEKIAKKIIEDEKPIKVHVVPQKEVKKEEDDDPQYTPEINIKELEDDEDYE